jgi:hypothetical protein
MRRHAGGTILPAQAGEADWEAPVRLKRSSGGGAGRRNPVSRRTSTMIRMFVRHKVNDYTAWRKGYDAFGPIRTRLGTRGHAVYCDADDVNDVTAWHDFDNIEVAKAFASSSELRAAMKGAGVVGAPTIWFTRHT